MSNYLKTTLQKQHLFCEQIWKTNQTPKEFLHKLLDLPCFFTFCNQIPSPTPTVLPPITPQLSLFQPTNHNKCNQPTKNHMSRCKGRRCFLQNLPKRDFSAADCSCNSAKTWGLSGLRNLWLFTMKTFDDPDAPNVWLFTQIPQSFKDKNPMKRRVGISLWLEVMLPGYHLVTKKRWRPKRKIRKTLTSSKKNTIWMFPKIGVPQNGFFIMENPIKIDDLGPTPIFGNTHLWSRFLAETSFSPNPWSHFDVSNWSKFREEGAVT